MPYFTWDMMMIRLFGIFMFGALLCSPDLSLAQPTLESRLNSILKDECFTSAGFGIMLKDLQKDSVLFAHESSRALPPASTLKLLTTAAAYEVLGPDFRFATKFGYTGRIRGDTLFGDLVIKGSGDPTLGSNNMVGVDLAELLVDMTDAVKTTGIKYVTGSVIGDASYYDLILIPRTWPYQDMANYYGAFCGGLNVHDNLHFLKLGQQNRVGALVTQVEIAPFVPNLEVSSLVRSGPLGSGDNAYIMGAPFQINRHVVGTIPPGTGTFTIKGSLPDPALFLATHLRMALTGAGIASGGMPVSVYSEGPAAIHQIREMKSPSLDQIAKKTNQSSVNLFAEGLGLRAAKEKSFSSDSEHWLHSFWSSRAIDMSGCRFSDYAGLAPDNAISASAMVQILQKMHSSKHWDNFLSSLAIAGESGTMRSMLRHSKAKGKIFAKSGLINGVRNYAGYIQGYGGKWYAFAIMTHNPTCNGQVVKKKLEQLLETLYLASLK